MRELKFRAWNTGANVMVYDIHLCNFSERLQDKTQHVMQFTGLRDKNGKEIYEGDIVEDNDGPGEVYWHEKGYWGFMWFDEKGYECNEYLIDILPCKIIGNIYENIELIKKE